MKFATLGHIIFKENLKSLPKTWITEDLVISPEFNFGNISGHIAGLLTTAKELMMMPRVEAHDKILQAATLLQNQYSVELIQLGGLTTSVTSGGLWLAEQKEYHGYINHGDSYTAAVCYDTTKIIISRLNKKFNENKLAIVGAYGIIGEALSKLLTPQFKHTLLIGRREEQLKKLSAKIKGNFSTTTELNTQSADVIITATSHPSALLDSKDIKKNAVIIDVSQPPNISEAVCFKRPDIVRIDGGYVDYDPDYSIQIPGLPEGKIFACIAEVIMQALENDKNHHIGSIDLRHLDKSQKWAKKYNFEIKSLSSFGKKIHVFN